MEKRQYAGTGRKRKKRVILAAAAGFLLLAAAFWALQHWKPDWIFLACHQVRMGFVHDDLTEIDKETLSYIETDPQALAGGGGASPAAGQNSSVLQMDETLLLVNGSHPLPSGYEPSLETYKETDVEMDGRTTEAYELLSREVEKRFGTPLYIKSSYRTREEQEQEKEEQPEVAASAGASEHETGLALDVYVPYYAGYGFLKSEAGQYVYENCWKYGFIIRYPYGKEEETGIPFEPWHLRYVGLPHAEIMYKNSWTLEEYLEGLEPGKFYRYESAQGTYLISRQEGENLQVPQGLEELRISPDNQGYYVISGKCA